MGQAGSGKSALALDLLSRGATLVSDDRTVLTRDGEVVVASSPPAISGLIEARGVGILRADRCKSARLCAVVELDMVEAERLPPKRCIDILSVDVRVFYRVDEPYFAAALLQVLKGGVLDPDEHP